MASRENQGLHIALILLIMLTVGLCVVSYVFYSKAERRRVEAEDATNRSAQARDDLAKANFKVQTLTYMINGGNKTWTQMEADLANIPGGEANDPTMDSIRKNFQDNMRLYGAPDQEYESARNYESLPAFLLSRIRDLNQQLTDLRRSENDLTAQKAQLEQAAAERSKKFEDAANQARQELEAERAKFVQDLAEVRKQMEDIAGQVAAKDAKVAELTVQLDDQRTAMEKRIEDLGKVILDQKTELRDTRTTSFESPDAIVTTVNQKEGILYINVGSADGLRLQQTFSVYDKGTTGVMDAVPKGRVEVGQVLGAHVAMCRILEDKVSNIIVPGDLLVTPAWDPGRRIHFAITGFVDVDGDNRDDRELLERLIRLNGGEIDDEVSVQTRYLIQGEDKGTGDQGAATDAERADFNAKITAATEIGVDRLSVDKLLSLMGWRAEVRSVTVGSGTPETITDQPAEAAAGEAAAGEGAAGEGAAEGAADEGIPAFRKRTPPARGTDGAF
ncbi:MAG: BRCT domain-containing protein [Pirellulaceae bacterium]